MGGGAYYITMPKMVRVNLTGKLQPWVAAKDIILEVLRIMSVKGGVGKIVEYGGEGVKTLSVPERATITNMGAELGATTSVFPSDELTRQFLKAQGREEDWVELTPDEDAVRWIGVGGFIVSLSLMSWLFLPLYGAVLYRYRGEGYGAVLKAIVWMLLIAGILITCPDLVMAGTVGLSCVFMLMLALEKGWYQVAVTKVMTGIGISVVGVPVGILAYFFFFGAEYQKSRILAMFAVNKSQMMEGTTLGAVRELLSKCMAVGRATGVEDFWTGDRISSADYMMLGIAGYCGILVMVLCIAIIAGLLCWFLRSALKQKNQLGMMMGFGCVMVLAIQFLLSLLANIGVSGFGQGAWCLFFGYGRSGQMVSAVLMGILLSIYRHQNVTPELVVEKRAVAS